MKKIYLIAGEPSGDLHGANLVEALKQKDPQMVFRGFGGVKMAKAGVELDQTIDRLSFMGFSEVVKHLPVIAANFRIAKKAIREWNPDAIVYVDFPGFNMRIAKWAHKKGYRNFYYIAPQAWAWKEGRVVKMKKYIHEMFCILPFEKSFFARFDYDVNYVGHPLVDIIQDFRQTSINGIAEYEKLTDNENSTTNTSKQSTRGKKVIALLPGSRQQEVMKILPVQLEAVRKLNDFKVIVGKSPNVSQVIYDKIASNLALEGVCYEENTYALLSNAFVACVASGTATLETALFKVPEVVCFKGSWISYFIARRLVKVPYISLVNLIMGQEIVKELIQQDLTPDNLRKHLVDLTVPVERNKIEKEYKSLEEKLGLGGAAEKTAKIIISKLES